MQWNFERQTSIFTRNSGLTCNLATSIKITLLEYSSPTSFVYKLASTIGSVLQCKRFLSFEFILLRNDFCPTKQQKLYTEKRD